MQFEPLEQWIWLPEDHYPDRQTTTISSMHGDQGKDGHYTVVRCEKTYALGKAIQSVHVRTSGDTFFRLYVNGAEQPVYRFPTAPGTYEVVIDFTSIRNGTYPMREYVGLYAYIGKDGEMVTERFSLEVVAQTTEAESITEEPTETVE